MYGMVGKLGLVDTFRISVNARMLDQIYDELGVA